MIAEFAAAVSTYAKALQRLTAAMQLNWAARIAGPEIGKLDAQYLRNLVAVAGSSQDLPAGVRTAVLSEAAEEAGDRCPACGSVVLPGEGACAKGHKWGKGLRIQKRTRGAALTIRAVLHHAPAHHDARQSALHCVPSRGAATA